MDIDPAAGGEARAGDVLNPDLLPLLRKKRPHAERMRHIAKFMIANNAKYCRLNMPVLNIPAKIQIRLHVAMAANAAVKYPGLPELSLQQGCECLSVIKRCSIGK
jgi:hypothetical protein